MLGSDKIKTLIIVIAMWLIAFGSLAFMFGIIINFFPAKLMVFPTLGLLLIFTFDGVKR